jgi:hypothetical protein
MYVARYNSNVFREISLLPVSEGIKIIDDSVLRDATAFMGNEWNVQTRILI